MKLNIKMLIAFLIVGLTPMVSLGILFQSNSQKAISNQVVKHLKSLRDSRKMSVQQFLSTHLSNARTLAKVDSVIMASETMEEAFDYMEGTIDNNRMWQAVSDRYHPSMEQFIHEYGYRDLYIISPDGDVVFSVVQKTDLGQNVYKALKGTPLSKCFRKTLQGSSLSDFELYSPHGNLPAAFAGALVKRDEIVVGVIALYISNEMINGIMMDRSGLGKTGETYLVGSDKQMRSNSYLDPLNHSVIASLSHPGLGRIDTIASNEAIAGNTGEVIATDYRGVKVLSAYTPVEIGELTWALIAQIDAAEAFKPITVQRYLWTVIALIGIIVVTVVSFIVSHRIASPLKRLTKASEKINIANLDIDIPPELLNSQDEIGALSRSFDLMAKQLKRAISKLELFKSAVETSSDAIGMSTPEGEHWFQNKAFDNLFGDIGSDPPSSVYVDENIGRRVFRSVMAGEPWAGEVKMYGHNRKQLYIMLRAYTVKDEHDNITALVGVHSDISESKAAEDNLRKAQAYISNIINSMPSVLVGVDSDGKVVQWNSEAERVTGIAVDDAVGMPIIQAFPDLSSEMERIGEAMQNRQTIFIPKQAYQQSGGIHYKDITVYPLIANGVEGVVIRVDDVTEKIQLEEMMVQSEKMLSVGGLAAGMAHEINNPLAGMIQNADVMKKRLTDTEMPANKRAAEKIGITMNDIKAFMEERGILQMTTAINILGHRIATIVNNMLSFARKSDAQVSSHNLLELCDKTLVLAATDFNLQKQYDFKDIEIIIEDEDNMPPVPCEGAKIQQVLLNILRNGAQAMHEAKTNNPRFIIRQILQKKRNLVCIEIEDNGPGMNEEIRKRVFEPFFTTKPVGLGTGLGLSVSYFIITEVHFGEMSVESTIGSGTKFIIRLPMGGKHSDSIL